MKAARLIGMCEVDVPLSHEQQFLVSLINRTASDSHPDAHACRLRLALACLGAGNYRVAWDVLEDYSQYLKKLGAVSLACRLTDEEEQALLSRFLDDTPGAAKHPGVTELSMRKLFFKAGTRAARGWWLAPGLGPALYSHELDLSYAVAFARNVQEANNVALLTMPGRTTMIGGSYPESVPRLVPRWLRAYPSTKWQVSP